MKPPFGARSWHDFATGVAALLILPFAMLWAFAWALWHIVSSVAHDLREMRKEKP